MGVGTRRNPDQTWSLRIEEQSQVGEARRVSATFGRQLGFDEEDLGRLAIVVNEAASNLLKHAKPGGDLLFRGLVAGGGAGVEVIAIDHGPGILDTAASVIDGVSTAGTMGEGLGSISRQSDDFQLYSMPGRGTCLVAEVWRDALRQDVSSPFDVGVINVAKPGETACGDGWAVGPNGVHSFLLVDGLGHGPGAAEASSLATRQFSDLFRVSPAQAVETLHRALLGTRGAAVAVATIDPEQGTLSFAGIGNISAAIVDFDGRRSLVSRHGIVGYQMRTVQEFTCAWAPTDSLVLHSDGLADRWDLSSYPGILTRDPSVIAAALYRDCVRGTDDATVMVVCNNIV